MRVKEGLSSTFSLSGLSLWLLSIWPDPHASLSELRRPNLRLITITCIFCFYLITPQMWNVILARGNVSRMVEAVASVNFASMALCKLIITYHYGERLQVLVKSVAADWMTIKSNTERNTMRRIAKIGRKMSFKCYMSTGSTAIFYSCAHMLSGMTVGLISSAVDSFVSMLLLHVCAQLINLRTRINNLVEDSIADRTSFKFKKNLATIVERHLLLIRNARTVDECYSTTLFGHMLTATLQLCLETFQVFTMITDRKDMGISLLKIAFLSFYGTLVLTHLFFYCYAAERLLKESTAIADGIYECKWYDLSAKDARNLMFIVNRSRIPLKLSAGKFGTFSMEMFGILVKSSMGYLSALLTMR